MVEGGGGTGVAVTEREVEETGEEEESGTQGAEAVGETNSQLVSPHTKDIHIL